MAGACTTTESTSPVVFLPDYETEDIQEPDESSDDEEEDILDLHPVDDASDDGDIIDLHPVDDLEFELMEPEDKEDDSLKMYV